MADKSQQSKARDGDGLSILNMAIDVFNDMKEDLGVTAAKAAFDTVAILLALIRVCPLLSCNERLQAHT